jgi:DNA repair protein RadA/Sms
VSVAKPAKTVYRCDKCEHEQARYFGICPRCHEGMGVEVTVSMPAQRAGAAVPLGSVPEAQFRDLSEVQASEHERIGSGIPEFDRVLGGGIVPGSYIALTGPPGAGKTTVATQAILSLSDAGRRVGYVSGEESESQARMRFERLGARLGDQSLPITTEISAERVAESVEGAHSRGEPLDFLVVDSIQTLISESHTGRPGSVGQVAECAERLRRAAKGTGTTILIVGQVTKDGDMAGPRLLEHMVDVVLDFDSDRDEQLRILRAVKNRFGSIDEIGVFEMTGSGLVGVEDPSSSFLADRDTTLPGSAVCAVLEGTRVVLCEIQALVRPSNAPVPMRQVSGLDPKRLAMLLAVLGSVDRRHRIGSHDVFVSVLGGLKVVEPAADLAVTLALTSALSRRVVLPSICAFGEVTLQGKVRAAGQGERRRREAQRLGYSSLDQTGGLQGVLDEALGPPPPPEKDDEGG